MATKTFLLVFFISQFELLIPMDKTSKNQHDGEQNTIQVKLKQAILECNLKQVELIVKEKTINTSYVYPNSWTPLHFATYHARSGQDSNS
ncbi:MAG TPA: hypothetical protein VHA52_01915, partial [Candidatus Babeliaceae bacterium]|nr:hypothetical protein [Candidatus Babeliaceae bacterium]